MLWSTLPPRRKHQPAALTGNAVNQLASQKKRVDDGTTNLLVVIYPFAFTQVNILKHGPRINADALPCTLQAENQNQGISLQGPTNRWIESHKFQVPAIQGNKWRKLPILRRVCLGGRLEPGVRFPSTEAAFPYEIGHTTFATRNLIFVHAVYLYHLRVDFVALCAFDLQRFNLRARRGRMLREGTNLEAVLKVVSGLEVGNVLKICFD